MTKQGFGFCGAAMAGLLLMSGAAWAGGDKAHAEHKGMTGIEAMDTNADGQLSQDEHLAGARKMFETMDADKNGKVTAEEMEAAHAAVVGKHAADKRIKKGKMTAAEKIKVVDTDGDGVLTAEEHANGAKTMFGKMDTNGDGQLSKAEHASGHKMLKKAAK